MGEVVLFRMHCNKRVATHIKSDKPDKSNKICPPFISLHWGQYGVKEEHSWTFILLKIKILGYIL